MSYYDEVEIEDFEFDEEEGIYYYPCPWFHFLVLNLSSGDLFQISLVRRRNNLQRNLLWKKIMWRQLVHLAGFE
jgi:hypothetical protein